MTKDRDNSIDEFLAQQKRKFLELQKSGPRIFECPAILNDERLEDAFKVPKCDEEGYCECLPAIWNDYGYGKFQDGVLFITLKSASIGSRLYSKFLDEEALVWDSNKERLLLYVPDPEGPRMAFKGSSWQFAKRLKPEYGHITSLRDIYAEYIC